MINDKISEIMKWISVEDKSPKKKEIVLAWLFNRNEPAVVVYDVDEWGPVWQELVATDIHNDREDKVIYWMRIPKIPKTGERRYE